MAAARYSGSARRPHELAIKGAWTVMERRQGLAKAVRHTATVTGSGAQHGSITTTHDTLFLVEGRQVLVRSPEPVAVQEGDEVAIAGRFKNGMFNVVAYRNLTTSAEGHVGVEASFVIGVLGIMLALVVPIMIQSDDLDWLRIVLAPLFLACGAAGIANGYRTLRWARLLREPGGR